MSTDESTVEESTPGLLPNPLQKYGIKFAATYIDETLGNVSGRLKQGAVYDGRLNLADRLAKAGRTARVYVSCQHVSDSRRRAFPQQSAEFFGGERIEALPSTRLHEIWFEQKWETTRSLGAGQLAADTEFINAKYADVFTNASIGWPAITSVNLPSGGPSPPLAVLGARLRANLTDNCTVSAAIFDGNAAGPGLDDPQLRDNHGVNFRINDPLLVIGEVQHIWTAPIRTFAAAGRRDTAGEPARHPCVRGRDRGSLHEPDQNPDRSKIAEAVLEGEFLRVPSVRLDPGLQAIGNGTCCRAEIDELSEKAITKPPASLQNAKRRPLIGQSFGGFRNIRVLVDAALSPMDAARRCLMCSRPIWVGIAHS